MEGQMAGTSSRWWLTEDAASVVIEAAPEVVYDLVAELTRMGEWSPECDSVEWTDGATGPAVGARFVGHNRGGPFKLLRWSRAGRVLVANRAREFAFATEEGGREGVIWRYQFDAVADATRVTESYQVESIPVWARVLDVPTNRAKKLQAGMRYTLEHLKAAAESVTVQGAASGCSASPEHVAAGVAHDRLPSDGSALVAGKEQG
jgi:Polyketide cyclase / dehydrase and lipid transport